jgi:hypothetical protein
MHQSLPEEVESEGDAGADEEEGESDSRSMAPYKVGVTLDEISRQQRSLPSVGTIEH